MVLDLSGRTLGTAIRGKAWLSSGSPLTPKRIAPHGSRP
jgi:hypothetical protein